jgi:hypothetical protein
MRSAFTLVLAAFCGVLAEAGTLPEHLRDTGYGGAELIAFSPQYPLWSDGASKQRWIFLPPGTHIDASDPDAWDFPSGTRLYKDFSFGRRIETRVIERNADGSWQFGVYVWNEAGTDAVLAPADGIRTLPVAAAPEGRYAIPSVYDCQACHEGPRVPVLGFSTLQLSADRDPLAPHADASPSPDLAALTRRGLLRNLPRELLDTPPRIAAASPVERAALGYLHGNCGHCHGAADVVDAAVPVGLRLAQGSARQDGNATLLRSLVNAPSRFRFAGAAGEAPPIIRPGNAGHSVLPRRMRARDPRTQMPPLGTALPDLDALALLTRWIEELPVSTSTTLEH